MMGMSRGPLPVHPHFPVIALTRAMVARPTDTRDIDRVAL